MAEVNEAIADINKDRPIQDQLPQFRTGEDSFSRCNICEGRAPNSFRVTSGESVVMQRCINGSDGGRLL